MSKKAFVRYTKDGKLVAGSLTITNGPQPSLPSTWKEVPIEICCVPTYTIVLKFTTLELDYINDIYNVDDWNQFFGLGDYGGYGNPFKSAVVNTDDNQVSLIGGSGITIKDYLFNNVSGGNLLEFIDDGAVIKVNYGGLSFCSNLETVSLPNCVFIAPEGISDCISLISLNLPNVKYASAYSIYGNTSLTQVNFPELIYAEYEVFKNCSAITTFTLPKLKRVGNACFENCTSLTTLYAPNCIELGDNIQNNNVFSGIFNNVINITIDPSLVNDGDLFILSINNTITVNDLPVIPFTGYTGNLTIQFNNISNANLLVGDASDVNDWNTFFNTPSWSTDFTGVTIVGNFVTLTGGANVPLLNSKFEFNSSIVSVSDTGCVPYIGNFCFNQCYSLTTVSFAKAVIAENYAFYNEGPFFDGSVFVSASLPELTTAGSYCFWSTKITTINFPELVNIDVYSFGALRYVTSINLPKLEVIPSYAITQIGEAISSPITINIPSCTNLGPTVGNDDVFYYTFGKNITLTVPIELMTVNAGNPDGDIQTLQADNTVTIITT